jgi:hypothetical protein
MAAHAKYAFLVVMCRYAPTKERNDPDSYAPAHLNNHYKTWWVKFLSRYGVLDWHAMDIFVEQCVGATSVTWAHRVFVVSLDERIRNHAR